MVNRVAKIIFFRGSVLLFYNQNDGRLFVEIGERFVFRWFRARFYPVVKPVVVAVELMQKTQIPRVF